MDCLQSFIALPFFGSTCSGLSRKQVEIIKTIFFIYKIFSMCKDANNNGYWGATLFGCGQPLPNRNCFQGRHSKGDEEERWGKVGTLRCHPENKAAWLDDNNSKPGAGLWHWRHQYRNMLIVECVKCALQYVKLFSCILFAQGRCSPARQAQDYANYAPVQADEFESSATYATPKGAKRIALAHYEKVLYRAKYTCKAWIIIVLLHFEIDECAVGWR